MFCGEIMRTAPKTQQTDLALCLVPHHQSYRRMYPPARAQLQPTYGHSDTWLAQRCLADKGTRPERRQNNLKTPDSGEPRSSLQRWEYPKMLLQRLRPLAEPCLEARTCCRVCRARGAPGRGRAPAGASPKGVTTFYSDVP